MYSKTYKLAILMLFFGCNAATSASEQFAKEISAERENPYSTIAAIPVPEGFTRISYNEQHFASWLRNVHLKKDKTVYQYNGKIKANQEAQFAVLDISVGNKDLQQCADAVMRLRAEYLFDQKKFEEIIFYDNDRKKYKFQKPYTHDNLQSFLQRIFGTCGSASLSKQLSNVDNFSDIAPGDVIIRGGFPGHAVIVVDVAVNADGKKAFLIAQSYMPAQDIHLLVNPSDNSLSPWYPVTDDPVIETPEYTFRKTELKRW